MSSSSSGHCPLTLSKSLYIGNVLQMVTEHAEDESEGQMQLSDDQEEDLCKVWDMAMDKVWISLCLMCLTLFV